VIDARLNLSRARLEVRWRPDKVELSTIARWLEQFGYSPHPAGDGASAETHRAERQLLRKVGVTWALAANVMLLAFALYAGLGPDGEAGLFGAFRWLSFALAAGSVAYGGSTFFRRAWTSLRPLLAEPSDFDVTKLSIDIPISLGILGGFGHSAWATIRGTGEVWFDSVCVLIAALLTARWLQIRGQRVARDAADRLLSVVPTSARRWSGGEAEVVPTEQLEAGDVVEVRSGDTVPVDGRVVYGQSALQKGVLTGESRPERVEPGDSLFAGSKNTGQTIRVRVTAAGEESRIGQLMEWIEETADNSAPIVQLADRLAGIFVVAILGGALLTGLGWSWAGSEEAVRHAVALLVISCPCALGMATPLAMTVGVGRAARRGIFIKDDGVFERLANLGELIVDKTGTLTAGQMEVVETHGSTEALARAVALERGGHHPVARALEKWGAGAEVLEADPAAMTVADAEETAGRGIAGTVDGVAVCAGQPDWVARQTGDEPGAEARAFAERSTADGYSPVAVGVAGEYAAVIALGDPIRPQAAEFIDKVRRSGVRVRMLSGDHPEVVAAVADRLGIPAEDAEGHVTPEEKRDRVEVRREALTGADRPVVAMVGDGVNDAAALRAADVGIAVDGSANPSLVAADVFTTRGGMEPLFELVAGSEGVLGTVRRNIGMSVAYNTVGITAAAAGLVTPLVAAVAMPVSSIAVVLSSMLQESFEGRTGGSPSSSAPATSRPQRPRVAGERV
jgi:Cu2+-exporting ATPase